MNFWIGDAWTTDGWLRISSSTIWKTGEVRPGTEVFSRENLNPVALDSARLPAEKNVWDDLWKTKIFKFAKRKSYAEWQDKKAAASNAAELSQSRRHSLGNADN